MKKRLLLLIFLLCAAALLSGCQYLPDDIAVLLSRAPAVGEPQVTAAPIPLPDVPLSYLYFSESNSYYKRVQGYEYRAENGTHIAYFYMANKEELYPVPVDQAWADTLNSFITEYGMIAWNGFSGSVDGLLDGTQFYAEFTLSDGTNVKASGYGDFPDGYGGASKAIDAHFIQLLPEDMRDW